MQSEMEKSILESLEMEEELFPYIPELLQDLWALGSMPEYIIQQLRPYISGNSKILDLGCGKGAVAVLLAKAYGCHVTGVDASSTFLEVAHEKAKEYQVKEHCTFIEADIRNYVILRKQFDVVIYSSLGAVLGNFKEIVSALRNMVRDDGLMIIDDGYLKNAQALERDGYHHYRSHKETLNLLTSFGDRLIEEKITEQETAEINEDYMEKIRKRANTIVRKNPETEQSINAYILRQEEECQVLDEKITGATWLLQKQDK